MRKRFITLLFVLVCAGLLTGCGKNIDKMTMIIFPKCQNQS